MRAHPQDAGSHQGDKRLERRADGVDPVERRGAERDAVTRDDLRLAVQREMIPSC
jgi:hypothetical protein